MSALLVALAGSAGAVTRFVVDGSLTARRRLHFPLATLLINVTGSFVLGVLTGCLTDPSGGWRLVAGLGFCGGYTTFSTASFETVRLVRQGSVGTAFGFAVGWLAACVAAAAAGWWLGAWWLGG